MFQRCFPIFILTAFLLFSCSSDSEVYIDDPIIEDPVDDPINQDPDPESPVNFDLANIPYETLSEYNFYEGNMADLSPVYGVLPYDLITSLFTDYALKKRFIWMPQGVKANYVSDGEIFNFPVGTVIIKNFYYNNVLPENATKILETRLLIKKEEGWVFAEYIWNGEQTDANLDMLGRNVPIEWIQNGDTKNVNYRIPSEFECITCHKSFGVGIPIGPKPQNINSIFNYDDGSENQMTKWEDMGYLDSNYPSSINSVVKWDDASEPLDLRMRSYFDINCAHCHITDGHCDYRPIRLAFNESSNPDNLGICIEPDESIDAGAAYIVSPGNVENSVIYHRMNSTESIQMPLMGANLIHDEAVDLLVDWINSLSNTCE